MKIEFTSKENPYTEMAVVNGDIISLEEAFAIYIARKETGEEVELSYALTTRLRWQELELQRLMLQ